jgi:purine-binding chemotaxis protein CheW
MVAQEASVETSLESSHIEEVGDQYLTFNLADEDYGIDILRVQEIRGWDEVTRLPNAPDYVRGVVNIRGTIVPVYDLRLKFNMPFREYTQNTVVIVIKTETPTGEKSIGVVVDAVADVLHGYLIEITRSPDFGNEAMTEAISGLATFEDKMVVLLDVDKLVRDEQEADLSSDEEDASSE